MDDHGDLVGAAVDHSLGRLHDLAPARLDEAGRHPLGQDRAAVAVHCPQSLDRAEQRITRPRGAEGEGGEECWGKPPHGGIALDHFRQAVVGRPGEILGEADAAFELVPAHLVLDAADRIAPGRAGIDEQATEPRMEAGGILQQPRLPEQPVGAGAIGAAEQRAYHFLDYDQCRVGQRRLHLDHSRNEHGEPARTFETAQMLRGDDASGPCDDGIASGMDAPRPIGWDPDAARRCLSGSTPMMLLAIRVSIQAGCDHCRPMRSSVRAPLPDQPGSR